MKTPTPDELGIDPGTNPWGIAAFEFCRHISRVGEAQALMDEAAAIDDGNPIWDHDDWKKYILNRILGREPPKPTVGLSAETYECHYCQDRAYILDERDGVMYSKSCRECIAGRNAERGNETARDKAVVDAYKADKRNVKERDYYSRAAENIRCGRKPGKMGGDDEVFGA